MPRPVVLDAQQGFSGGLNTVTDPAFLRPDQARQLTNFRLTAYGAAKKRGGTQAFATANPATTSAINGLIWWQKKALVFGAVDGGVLYSNIALGGSWSAVTGSARWTASMAVFTDGTSEALYSAGAIKSTDGTSGTNLTWTDPAGGFMQGIIVHNDRLWGWSTASPFLCYSALDNGDTLGVVASGGGQIRINTSITANIYTCAVVGTSLLIFQDQGVSRLTGFGQSDITVQPVSVAHDVNVVGQWGVTVYNNIAWVVTRKGLYMVTEGSATPVATPDIPDPLVAVFSGAVFQYSRNIRVTYNTSTNEVLIWVPSVGVYAYHTVLRAWSGPWDGTYNSFTPGSIPNGGAWLNFSGFSAVNAYVLFTDNTGGCWVMDNALGVPAVYKDAVANDGTGGSAYTSVLVPRRMFGQEVSQQAVKSWRWANVLANLTTGATAPTITTQGTIGGADTQTVSTPATGERQYYNQSSVQGPYIDVTITDTGAAASSYAGVEVEGFLMGRR